MRIKKRGRTTEIKFDNRRESIAFLRAMGMNKGADALEEAEAREKSAQQAVAADPNSPALVEESARK